jgi:hypothetical protein
MRITVGIAIITIASSVTAQASDVNWKLYAGVTVGGIAQYCFYDANGVVKQSDTHLRVWTKCLSAKGMDSVDPNSESHKKIIERAAQKITGGYVPPIIVINTMKFDKIAFVAGHEEAADIGDIKPNCKNVRRAKLLSSDD